MWLKNKKFIAVLSIFALFIGLVGCIKKEIVIPENPAFLEVTNPEDVLIMQAYAALDTEDYESARELFTQSYQLNPNPSYLKEILGILVVQRDFDNAKKEAYAFLQKYPTDETVRSVLIGILTNEKDFDNALKEATTLLNHHKNAESYELLSSVYFLRQDFHNAAKNLQLAYNLNPSDILLDKLAAIHLLFLKDTKTTIKLYETQIKNYGISKHIGDKLAAIYLDNKQFLDSARVYTMLFEELQLQEYAQATLEIYAKTKRLDLAEKFLLNHPSVDSRDMFLFEVYRLNKDTQNSIKQAEILYQSTQDINFLAYKAMLTYENTKVHTKTYLQTIEKDLKEAAQKTNDALYWNFLGYLMIDHDFNDLERVKEGMEYVQNALKQESENPYYLDSLAWGYFKLNDCAKAKEIIEQIAQEEIEKEEELKAHYQAILKCKRK